MWIVWPFKKKNFGSAWAICSEFRHLIDPTAGRFIIQDETKLPHAKNLIFDSICIVMMTETDKKIYEAMKSYAFELAFFQQGVGEQPLHPLGIDLDGLEADEVGGAGVTSRTKADPAGKEKYDRFKLLRDADWAQMQATMAKLQQRARAS